MAVTFLEPGGDADFGTKLWGTVTGSPTVATDFVHNKHLRSLGYPINASARTISPSGTVGDSGGRYSFYLYINALPAVTGRSFSVVAQSGGAAIWKATLTTAGVLQLTSGGTQIGSNGPTLLTGQWYRMSVAFTISSTTVNRIEYFVNGKSAISITNATLANTGTSVVSFGNETADTAVDIRVSDVYIDNSSSLTDPGDIWVTVKRPFANGSVNGFTTQIGSGGSGYGTGHSSQVNERALNTANGWSMVGAGSAVTEEYTIEGASVGDFDLTNATLIDFMGWIYASAGASETGSIIVANVSSNISLTNVNTAFTKMAGSTTYPTGGTAIGIITSTTLTTVSLYECGIILAYSPFKVPYDIPHTPQHQLILAS